MFGGKINFDMLQTCIKNVTFNSRKNLLSKFTLSNVILNGMVIKMNSFLF